MCFVLKNPQKYNCFICDYNTSNLKDYKKHLQTKKHNDNEMVVNIPQKSPLTYSCVCGNIYKYDSGYYRHRKTCEQYNKPNPEPFPITMPTKEITPELIIELIQQNKELQQTLIEQNRTIIELAKNSSTNNYINNNANNSNNKTFNLQVYLNETCKNAINLSEFVDKIQVSVADLEKVGEAGYAEGISKVFIKNLNDINVDERPIHCTDYKRETLYIKENNQWTKDDEDKTGLTKAIKQVTNKNINQIFEWQKLNPDYTDPESKQSDKYLKIVMNSMPGSTTEETNKNYEKVVKNIIKKTVVEK